MDCGGAPAEPDEVLIDLNPDVRGPGWQPSYGVDDGGCKCRWGRGDAGETFDVPPVASARDVDFDWKEELETEEQSSPPRGGGSDGDKDGDLSGTTTQDGGDERAIRAVLDALEDLWGELAGGGSGESPGTGPGIGAGTPAAPPPDLAPPGTEVPLPPNVTLPGDMPGTGDDEFSVDESMLVFAPIAELVAVGIGVGVGVGVGVITEEVIEWITEARRPKTCRGTLKARNCAGIIYHGSGEGRDCGTCCADLAHHLKHNNPLPSGCDWGHMTCLCRD